MTSGGIYPVDFKCQGLIHYFSTVYAIFHPMLSAEMYSLWPIWHAPLKMQRLWYNIGTNLLSWHQVLFDEAEPHNKGI